MLKIVGHPMTRVMRVLWLAEELGLEIEVDPVSPGTASLRALNPSGKVPILLTDDGAISDSVAIMTYLADREGRCTHPAGTVARGRQDAVTNFLVAEVDAALWLAAKHSFALPEAMRRPEIKEVAAREYARALDFLAEMKGAQPYLAGDAPTVPDFLLAHCTGWAKRAKFPEAPEALLPLVKSMVGRPAFARVRKRLEAA